MGNLLRQARRRILGNQLFAEGANAGSAALVAFILLLLFGTQTLSWPVALAIPLAAAGFGIYRVRRHMPSRYAVAQLVDRRLGLADNLSTALFFSEVDSGARVAPDIRRAQFEAAGRIAQSVDVRRAVPYAMPRAVYPMAALALAAGSLFALRYGLSRRLDLRQPLASFLPESLTGGKLVHQANHARPNARQTPETPGDGSTLSNQDRQSPGQDPNQEFQTPGESPTEAIASMDAKSVAIQKAGERNDTEMASDDADAEGADANGRNGEQSRDGQPGDSKSVQSGKPRSGEQRDPTNASESSSLMSKLKDAFQNLLSSARPRQNQQGSPQQGKERKSASGKSQPGSQQNGKDGQPRNGSQQGDAQEGEGGQEASNSENAQQGKGQGKSDSEQPGKQPGGGIGSQDGDKAIRDAGQLAAMGKISQILGKRSATISGEATVEVETTSQQLRTPYAQKGAEHTQGGAEISRDEVPVALQPYVQQYFEQVRKQAGTAAKK